MCFELWQNRYGCINLPPPLIAMWYAIFLVSVLCVKDTKTNIITDLFLFVQNVRLWAHDSNKSFMNLDETKNKQDEI